MRCKRLKKCQGKYSGLPKGVKLSESEGLICSEGLNFVQVVCVCVCLGGCKCEGVPFTERGKLV